MLGCDGIIEFILDSVLTLIGERKHLNEDVTQNVRKGVIGPNVCSISVKIVCVRHIFVPFDVVLSWMGSDSVEDVHLIITF